MRNIVIAAVLAATATCADATTFKFSGTDFDGFAVSGAVIVDTTALAAANGATPPASSYYFQTGDAASTTLVPFLSVSFTSAGSNPALLAAGGYTYQLLQNDPADGSLGLELDYQVTNPNGTLTSSTFTLSGFDAFASKSYGGIRLPDFANAGTVYFDARGGTGITETYDTEAAGAITFSAAVPEASTWVMLTLGFGTIGHAARRRRRLSSTTV